METRKRKRGIKASRVKLEEAMLNAGIETQFALASKIAESEGLEKIPKDLVSKVFRERAVSTHNLARVARALQVEAHTIYLSSETPPYEQVADFQIESESANHVVNESAGDDSLPSPRNTGVLRTKFLLMGALLLSLCFFAVYLAMGPSGMSFINTPSQADSDDGEVAGDNKALINKPFGKVLLLIQTDDGLKKIGKHLVDELHNTDFIGAVMVTQQQTAGMSLPEILTKWQVDGVLLLSALDSKHYASIKMELISESKHEILFEQVVHKGLLNESSLVLSARIHNHLKQFIRGEQTALKTTIAEPAMKAFLAAKDRMYLAHSYDALNESLTLLTQSYQVQVGFAEAYAEVCRVKVRMSWIQDETKSLATAAAYCEQAEELNALSPAVISAKAELLSRTGKALAAIEYLEPYMAKALQEASHDFVDPDTFALFAELLLVFVSSDEFESSEREREDDANIVVYAERAVSIAPNHWRALNTLGNYYFSKGDIRAAASRFGSASAVVKQPVILANLGTMQMCFGELDKAKETYLDLINSSTNNYLAYENLGSVHMFEHNYAQALEYKLNSVELQPDLAIHQVWGSLAEVYLRNKNLVLASQHYQKALRTVERDELLDNMSADGRLSKLYYQMKLHFIAPNDFTFDDVEPRAKDFLDDSSGLGLKSKSHLAWIAGHLGYDKNKREIWSRISDLCPVYEQSPELVFD